MSEVVISRRAMPFLSPVTKALAYRYFRQGWGMILAAWAIICVAPSALWHLIHVAHPGTADAMLQNLAPLQWIYFLFLTFGLPWLVQSAMCSVRPLYTQPLSTRRIVNTQLVLGLISVLGVHLLAILYYRLMHGGMIPMLEPLGLLLPGVCIASGLMALLVDFRWYRPWLVLTLLSVLGWWLGQSRFPGFHAETLGEHWLRPTLAELAILIPLAFAGYVIARITVEKDRRGALGSWRVVEEASYRLLSSIGRGRSTAVSAGPLRAQFLYQWWTRGLIAPIAVTVFLLVSLIAAWHDPRAWCIEYVTGLPVMIGLGMMMNGLVCGSSNSQKPLWEMDRYLSTRPVSDRRLAYVALANGLAGSATALVISLLFAVPVFGLAVLAGADPGQLMQMGMAGASGALRGAVSSYSQLLLLSVVCGWALLGCACCLTQTGRPWLTVAVWFAWVAAIVGNPILASILSPEAYARLMRLGLIGVNTLTVVGTVIAYWRGLNQGLIGVRQLRIGLVLWAIGSGLSATVVRGVNLPVAAVTGMAMAAGAIVALPLAASPLAVRWNRHR